MWGKTELKVGQVGKVEILSNTNLYELNNSGKLSVVRVLKKGEEYRNYGFKSLKGYDDSMYVSVGGRNYIRLIDSSIKYHTPSKAKLAQLNGQGGKNTKEPSKIPVTNINNGVGTLKGTITWQYNNFIGTKPDVGARIYVIPRDFNASNFTESEMNLFSMIGSMPNQSNAHFTKVNGYGGYEISDIPVGKYLVIISSNNTKKNV